MMHARCATLTECSERIYKRQKAGLRVEYRGFNLLDLPQDKTRQDKTTHDKTRQDKTKKSDRKAQEGVKNRIGGFAPARVTRRRLKEDTEMARLLLLSIGSTATVNHCKCDGN